MFAKCPPNFFLVQFIYSIDAADILFIQIFAKFPNFLENLKLGFCIVENMQIPRRFPKFTSLDCRQFPPPPSLFSGNLLKVTFICLIYYKE